MELNINFIYYYLRQVITGSNQGESQAQQITELITKRKKKQKQAKCMVTRYMLAGPSAPSPFDRAGDDVGAGGGWMATNGVASV